ncbi:hypothetical protein [Psychromicrobium xiongbiense]|uniref:hypothetical protein n=1 Tax=Psychromicrobium xiongbiense TaxID=3051184 RepID=UPI002555F598|nr:hypothetical protein [Psychromicrobium sp. YIM S02556]
MSQEFPPPPNPGAAPVPPRPGYSPSGPRGGGFQAPAGYPPPSQQPPVSPAPAYAPYASQGYPQQVPPQQVPPQQRKSRKGLLIGLGSGVLALILIVVGCGLWYANASSSHAPENQVKAFLDKLVAGQVEEALALSSTDLTDADKTLINNKVYGSLSNRVSSYTLGKTTVSNGKATVPATLSTGSSDIPVDFTLHASGKDIVVDTWTLEPVALPSLTVNFTAPASIAPTVAGVAIKPQVVAAAGAVPASLKSITLKALPGTYPVKVATQDAAFTVADVSVTVDSFAGKGPATATLKAVLTDAGKKAITDAVGAYEDGCAAKGSLVLTGCPFSGNTTDPILKYTISDAKWVINSRPTVQVAEWTNSGGWLVLSTTSGSASWSAKLDSATQTGTGSLDNRSFMVFGKVTEIKDGKANFTPDVTG